MRRGADMVRAALRGALIALPLLAGLGGIAHAQAGRDSAAAGRDSATFSIVAADSSGRDTTIVWERRNAVDTVVTYAAKDSIVYSIRARTMRLYRDAGITYGSMAIAADTITLNWFNSSIAAGGVRDTSGGGDSVRGSPRLSDGGDSYSGK